MFSNGLIAIQSVTKVLPCNSLRVVACTLKQRDDKKEKVCKLISLSQNGYGIHTRIHDISHYILLGAPGYWVPLDKTM
mgnify:CR=1 FL=1